MSEPTTVTVVFELSESDGNALNNSLDECYNNGPLLDDASWQMPIDGDLREEVARLQARLAIFEGYRSAMSGYAKGALTEGVARAAKAKLENRLARQEQPVDAPVDPA